MSYLKTDIIKAINEFLRDPNLHYSSWHYQEIPYHCRDNRENPFDSRTLTEKILGDLYRKGYIAISHYDDYGAAVHELTDKGRSLLQTLNQELSMDL